MTNDLSDWRTLFGSKLIVRVTAKAAQNRVILEQLPDNTYRIRVYVTTVAAEGKANAMVIKLLAKALGVPKSTLTITRGLTQRDKTIICSTASPDS